MPYHTPPQFVKEWHSLRKENIAFFMCLSEHSSGNAVVSVTAVGEQDAEDMAPCWFKNSDNNPKVI